MPDFFSIRSLSACLRAAPYTVASVGVLLVAAYLCLVNLDYAALWHDEAPAAFFGKTLLQQGDIVGWDGRNLVGGTNGRTLNDELRDVLPPLMYVLNAAGFAVFGINEIGARIVHAVIGIVALGVFYLLLRQHLSNYPRLMFFIFLFVAWSAQLLLYFRQSRYFSVMVLALVLIFYLYECYWRSRHIAYLPVIAVVAALSFFNHYAGGAATMLSLAAYHLLFRARATALREWVLFAICGVAVVAVGSGYLYWLGVIGGERSGFMAFAGQVPPPYQGDSPAFVLFFQRIWIYIRELFTADWISWPVFLWFAGMGLLAYQVRRKQVRRGASDGGSISEKILGDDLPLVAVGKVILMGVLFALFSAMLSEQAIWLNPFANLRYYMGALPLLLAMMGLFAEWVWRKSKIACAMVVAVLLFSSAGAYPFNILMYFSGQKTLGLHLFEFVREIHRPYRDSIRVVSDYLLTHAEQDDLVYVSTFSDREALIFTTGHHVLFNWALDEKSPLPRAKIESLDAPYIWSDEHIPDWIIVFGPLRKNYREIVQRDYFLVAEPDVHRYPSQRPELNMHAFTPLPKKNGVHIFRRKG